MLPAPFGQEIIAGCSRLSLNTGRRLRPQPSKDVMLDPAGVQPMADHVGLLGRTGAKAVIDGEPNHAPALPSCPIIGEQGQGEAVWTAGNSDRKMRRFLERPETCHQGGEFQGIDRRGRQTAFRWLASRHDGQRIGDRTGFQQVADDQGRAVSRTERVHVLLKAPAEYALACWGNCW